MWCNALIGGCPLVRAPVESEKAAQNHMVLPMSMLDWIPVVSTFKTWLADPKGRRPADYTCNMDQTACGTTSQAAAISSCNADITSQANGFLSGFMPNAGDQIIGGAVSAIAAVGAGVLIPPPAGLIIGALLALDGIINASMVISKLNQIRAAATYMKSICCVCRPPACGSAGAVATSLTISRWFWGPERSFKQTEAAMRAEAAADHASACVGDCTTGTCTPIAYVTEWDQSHFGMTKTTLTYDVYCECV